MADENDRLVTAVEAREIAGVPNFRVRNWTFSGQVTPRGMRGRFKTYRLSDLVRLNYLAENDPRSRKSS